MKFNITMKDPDGVSNSITDAVYESVIMLGLSEEEQSSLEETRREEVEEKLKKWFKYNEYLRVEVDLDNGTATILENQKDEF